MFENKTVIITGASSGIGAQTAKDIIKNGGKVIGVDIKAPDFEVAEFIQADLSDKASIDRAIAALPEGASALGNIAGLPPTQRADKILAVNLVGLKHFALGAIPKLADGATVVNLASLAGYNWRESLPLIKQAESLTFDGVGDFLRDSGMTGERTYSFTKEALIVWTMQNRFRWQSRGIRMNAVSPGPVKTPILDDFIQTMGKRVEDDMSIIGRAGEAEEIASVVTFLLSSRSAWLKGSNIYADGGMFANILAEQYQF
ncbi:coniferyl-alcohol dehydrogenase [Pluralibacter gergoviae]